MINTIITVVSAILFIGFLYLVYQYIIKPRRAHPELMKQPMPDNFKKILLQRVHYYRELSDEHREEFNRRVMRFIGEKNISGVETAVTDEDRLLVAASAIIPMFTFPYYRYPNVTEILLYPGSFDHAFHTGEAYHQRNILGMVGNGYMNGQVILSKPDLHRAFDGKQHQHNVGIHEFVHLIDMADGVTNGLPEIITDHAYAMAWLREIKKEISNIVGGHSDINPYALTNNAEFLAVVSEYFFDDPGKMKQRHPELYHFLVDIFKQDPDDFEHRKSGSKKTPGSKSIKPDKVMN